MATTTTAVTIDTAQATSCMKNLYESGKKKLGSLIGKDVCKLGSPYFLGIALMVIGLLTSVKILPIGVYFGIHISLTGALIVIVTAVKHHGRTRRSHTTTPSNNDHSRHSKKVKSDL